MDIECLDRGPRGSEPARLQLAEFIKSSNGTASAIAENIGCSRSHFSRVLNGRKRLSQVAAIKVFRLTGVKVEPIAGASDADIDALERICMAAAK